MSTSPDQPRLPRAFLHFLHNFHNPLPRTSSMTNRDVARLRVAALVVPVTLGLACGLKRDWNFCSPKDPCLSGFVCTEDFTCVRAPDGGITDSSAAGSADAASSRDSAPAVENGGDLATNVGPPNAVSDATSVDTSAPAQSDAPLVAPADAQLDAQADAPLVAPADAQLIVQVDAPLVAPPDAPPIAQIDAPLAVPPDAAPAPQVDAPAADVPPDAPARDAAPDVLLLDAPGICSCSGACEECNATGQCVPKSLGVPCGDQSNSECDAPDICDGLSRVCQPRFKIAGSPCRLATCDTGTNMATPPGFCDGAHANCPSATAASCAPFGCSGVACATNCGATRKLCGSTCIPAANCCLDADCGVVPNGTVQCSSGSCSIKTCGSGYRDCNGQFSDGCETRVTDDLLNCGECGLKCLPNSTCSAEVCTSQVGYPIKDCAVGLSAYQDTLFGFSISVPKAATLQAFGVIPSATGTWNLALYSDAGDRPRRLIAQTGDKTLTAYGGPLEFATSATSIAAGTYWLMAVRHSSTGAICDSGTGTQIKLWQTEPVSGALPDPFPDPSDYTLLSYQAPWNVYVVLRLPGS